MDNDERKHNNIWHLHSLSAYESQSYVFECRKEIYYKTQTGTSCENATPRPSGWESNQRPLDY